jgi:hypothetical protein
MLSQTHKAEKKVAAVIDIRLFLADKCNIAVPVEGYWLLKICCFKSLQGSLSRCTIKYRGPPRYLLDFGAS